MSKVHNDMINRLLARQLDASAVLIIDTTIPDDGNPFEAVIGFRRGRGDYGTIRYCAHTTDASDGNLFWGEYDLPSKDRAVLSGLERAGITTGTPGMGEGFVGTTA
jgi:hypothetical protein